MRLTSASRPATKPATLQTWRCLWGGFQLAWTRAGTLRAAWRPHAEVFWDGGGPGRVAVDHFRRAFPHLSAL